MRIGLFLSFGFAEAGIFDAFRSSASTQEAQNHESDNSLKVAEITIPSEDALSRKQRASINSRRRHRSLQDASNNVTSASSNDTVPVDYPSSHGDDHLLPSFPIQVYTVPIPETALYTDVLKPLDATIADNRMTSLVSIAISSDKTVIWYDHWEDGFEADIMKGSIRSSHTEVWGDGDATNGCRPDIQGICTDDDDHLKAGDSIVIESRLTVPRTTGNWFSTSGMQPDAGDRIYSNAPLVVSRSAYVNSPVGAVEVLEESKWGTDYELPVDSNSAIDNTDAHFAIVQAFVMSNEDGNEITLPDGVKAVLNRGQSLNFEVKKAGKRIHADYPVQVHLLTAESDDSKTMRWYPLLPHDQWSNSYLVPFGDVHESTRLLLYNPGARIIAARITTKPRDTLITETLSLRPGTSTFSQPLVSSAAVQSTSNFAILSVTDVTLTNSTVSSLHWGYSILPRNQLTNQALVGWGYACEDTSCLGMSQAAAVWVSGELNADLYVDEDNRGTNVVQYKLPQLKSVKLHVPPGSLLFATEPDSGVHGPPVNFAAAWGQDPASSLPELDLGVAVLPLPVLDHHLEAENDEVVPGEANQFILTIANYGQTNLEELFISMSLPDMAKFVPFSLKYSADGGVSFLSIDDVTVEAEDVSADGERLVSPLLTPDGFKIPTTLARRGGTHVLRFDIVVDPAVVSSAYLEFKGQISSSLYPELHFESSSKIHFESDLTISNRVYIGSMGTAGCSTAKDSVEAVEEALVTYCFFVTNSGSTYLNSFTFNNEELDILDADVPIEIMAPGETQVLSIKSKITQTMVNYARVEATPILGDGTPIKGLPTLAAIGSSKVVAEQPKPALDISNTIFKGASDSRFCSVQGSDQVSGQAGDVVTYCFKITNSGNTLMTRLHVTNIDLEYSNADLVDLAPNATTIVAVQSKINGNYTNVASVTGTAANAAGQPFENLEPVVSTDASEVIQERVNRVDLKPIACLEDAWKDAGNTQDLVCRAKEVYLDSWVSAPRLTCKAGEFIKVNLTASIHIASQRYDIGWYVASDGGDALHGTCHANAFRQGIEYAVTASKTDATLAGYVSWNEDKDADVCGDVIIVAGGGGNVIVPISYDQEIKCMDRNKNSNVDINVCFTWRTQESDGKCTLDRNDSLGREIDLFPGQPTKCFCTTVDIETINVAEPDTKEYANPC